MKNEKAKKKLKKNRRRKKEERILKYRIKINEEKRNKGKEEERK